MNNDAISRQDAIRWLKTECNPYGNPTLDYETAIKVMEHLDKMPAAEPEIMKKILSAGNEGKKVRIYIRGRLFEVRELAQ